MFAIVIINKFVFLLLFKLMKKDHLDIVANLVDAIRTSVPAGVKVPEYLMDLLSLGREAVYRRLRGAIMFSLDELVVISQDLNISLDAVINFKRLNSKVVFDASLVIDKDPRDELPQNLSIYIDFYKKIKQSANARVQIATNQIPYQFFLKHKLLAKVPSYKWIYQTQSFSEMIPFSDYQVSEEVSLLVKEFVEISNSVDINFIFDRDSFKSYVEDIVFFIKLNLIKENDIKQLKQDLLALINELEVISATGVLSPTAQTLVYISDISVETTYALYESDDFKIAHYRVYGISTITSIDPKICEAHKIWIDSLKRYSTLITRSADLVRSEYFNQQRDFINRLL